VAWLLATACFAGENVDVNVTPAMREYCHIVRFPQGWTVPPPVRPTAPPNDYRYDSEYEFRIPGLLETNFLIAGLVLPYEQYTVNKYLANFSDAKAPVLAASDDAWRSATPVRLTREAAVLVDPKGDEPMEFHGFKFQKSGEIWNMSRLSPDRAWLVLQSWSGRADDSENVLSLACLPFGCRGKLFFDVFNADTGKKVLTVIATYSGPDPGGLIDQSAWLTERYFIVPLGEHRERCLVCEFAAKRR
jgi:hypothetical protein